MISEEQKLALLLDVHRSIEEVATESVDKIVSPGELSVAYPPNGGLSEKEIAALRKLRANPFLESALRKIIADAASYPIFRLFSLLDGISDPYEYQGTWYGLMLASNEEETGMEDSLLHDDFFGTYWDWIKIRVDPGWKLDNFEGNDF